MIFFGVGQDAVPITFKESNTTLNSDSGIFEDTQCLIQEIASKYAYHECDKQRRLLYK